MVHGKLMDNLLTFFNTKDFLYWKSLVILNYTNLNKPKIKNIMQTITMEMLKGKNYGEILEIVENSNLPLTFHEMVNYMAAVKYLESKGLEIITSKRQQGYGSIGIFDPLTQRTFAITKAGYLRTYVPGSYFQPQGHKATYQLNPKNTTSPIGYSQSRVVFPKEYNYMAILLWKSIQRIRKMAK